HLLDNAGGSNLLVAKMLRWIGDAGVFEFGCPGASDDNSEVLLVAKVQFGVQVDFTTALKAILCGTHSHFDDYRFADLGAGPYGVERLRLRFVRTQKAATD